MPQEGLVIIQFLTQLRCIQWLLLDWHTFVWDRRATLGLLVHGIVLGILPDILQIDPGTRIHPDPYLRSSRALIRGRLCVLHPKRVRVRGHPETGRKRHQCDERWAAFQASQCKIEIVSNHFLTPSPNSAFGCYVTYGNYAAAISPHRHADGTVCARCHAVCFTVSCANHPAPCSCLFAVGVIGASNIRSPRKLPRQYLPWYLIAADAAPKCVAGGTNSLVAILACTGLKTTSIDGVSQIFCGPQDKISDALPTSPAINRVPSCCQ